MKRFRRWLFNGFAALSLVQCVLIISFWIRGYWTSDWFGYATHVDAHRSAHYCRLASGDGGFEVFYGYAFVRNGRDQFGLTWVSSPVYFPGESLFAPESKTFWFRHNFAALVSFKPGYSYSQVIRVLVPAWLPLFFFVITPAIKLRQWLLMKNRSRSNLCNSCGYDLRAALNRCPECGTAAKTIISN
jgi:hypothetical protein